MMTFSGAFYSFSFFLVYFFTLQYCIGFARHWHEYGLGVHVFPVLNPSPTSLPSHLLGSSQCTSPEHPVSCLKPGLVIYFTWDNLHVLMPFSHIIPHSPSPTETKRLYLFHCLTYRVIVTIFLNSIYMG